MVGHTDNHRILTKRRPSVLSLSHRVSTAIGLFWLLICPICPLIALLSLQSSSACRAQWTVMPNERWALLGPNGAGKSTLLKAIAAAARGEGSADGTLLVDSALRVGMLEQTAVSGSSRSVRDEVMSRMSEFNAASAELEAATAACVSGADCELERLEAAQIAFAAAGGYEIEARVSRVLQGLGFDQAEFDRPCDSFSGGWQMRIGLARLLLSEPEVRARAKRTAMRAD
eukprot:2426848-Pleurochrysis_carterae.AAC.5